MNKLFIALVGTSVTALVLAIGCGSWLFLKSWEEGKKLERQNQELKASLEASRIRIENFCEYPAEALCNIEEPRGSVSGAMSGITHLAPVPEPQNATTNAETVPANATKNTAAPETPLSSPAPLPTAEHEKQASPAEEPNGNVKTQSAPTAASDEKAESEKPASTELHASAVSSPSSPEVPALNEKAKKTWTSLNRTSNAMELLIAGEGTSLTAEGMLLADPLRYEVTLHGRWNVNCKRPENELIKAMRTFFRNNDTILEFSLAAKPHDCMVSQKDPRTVSVIIR